mgnify:CR=1 FL=1
MTHTPINHTENVQAKRKSYIIGFVLSLVLTFAAYFLITSDVVTFRPFLIPLLLTLALLQLVVQLYFFLHLGQEKGPRWNFIFFLSTVGIVLLILIGSLWIMTHLSYNHTMPEKVEDFIIQDEGIIQPSPHAPVR